ncbi:MAG: hypothetical protein COW65_13620 [Cytophagales bacterium CG18_big_fil_WC_8_21_14_2_50_42_9]|nr:MAG: hypothetical protein COW65_13620 [Cytophagales bacterium CG18_big_fil_WC_8_21_14_2_50_42_9]
MPYIKQLDSLRGIAVLLVVLSHWVPTPASQTGAFIGVNTFFVLSGFLISNILFQNKIEAETAGYDKLPVVKKFFFRRVLRIFPIYFLVVITLGILGENNIPGIKTELIYLLTFTTNFHFHYLKYFGVYTAHLWSLAVEEQFYLVWPWLLLFLQRKYIPVAILLFILTGCISQLFIQDSFDYLATYTCLDAFGLGALLSWVYTYQLQSLHRFFRILTYIILANIAIIILWLSGLLPVTLPTRTIVSLFALWIITYVIYNSYQNKKLRFAFLLNNRKLIAVGKISYGIYLYHFYIPLLASPYLKHLQFLLPNFLKPYTIILYAIGIFSGLIVFSWLSWRCIELPILRLKSYFNYQTPKPSPEKSAYTA